jgi:O-antigen/teichoic acid export membrane protein
LKVNSLLLLLALLPGTLVFAALGSQVVALWSAGHILPDRGFVALVALATLVHGTWYFLSNILLATNDHLALAKYGLGAAVLTLGLVAFLAATLGLVGVGLGLILGEALCAIAVGRIFFAHYRRVLQWT